MEVFDALGKELGLRCAILVGGVDMSIQQLQLAAKPHVIISTPGRILDHFSNTKGFSVYKCRFLVLDECDRLLDMDFERDLEQIFKRLNRARQTLLFTATGSSKIKALINRSSRAVMLRCSTDDGQKTNAILKQNVVLTNLSEKNAVLIRLLQKLTQQSIIFCGKVLEVQKLFYICERMQIKAGMIHGQMDQPTRLANLMLLKRREVQVLIATDVAARGLDVDDIQLVINYNVPLVPKEYIHRVGRTARAGKAGESIIMVTQGELEYFQNIEAAAGVEMARIEVQQGEVAELRAAVNAAVQYAERACKK